MIKAIIIKNKFGNFFIDTNNDEFEEYFIADSDINLTLNKTKLLTSFDSEPYGIYVCELSWIAENVYLDSYKNTLITWENMMTIKEFKEKCTWKECNIKATKPQRGKGRKQWANLCQYHHDKLESALSSKPFSPKILLRAWILASGGSKKMAKEA